MSHGLAHSHAPPEVKRKRSASELSSPPSAMAPAPGPAHLASRTLKRFRDSRPSEHELHRHTLQTLFAAQRTSSPPAAATAATLPPQPYLPSQPSLHRFWGRLSVPPPPVVLPSGPCDDCGVVASSGVDLDSMEIDDADGSGPLRCCVACLRRVCFGCSVSNLGDDVQCLRCAGRGRRWNLGQSRIRYPSSVAAH